MKKTLILIVLACILVLNACGSSAINSPEAPTGTDNTTAKVELTADEIYNEFLAGLSKKLGNIVLDDTHLDGFSAQSGMAGIAEIASPRPLDLLDKIGYSILDINEDGVSELLVFCADESEAEAGKPQRILCAYTVSDNKAALLFTGDSLNCYYLLSNLTILNRNYSDTASSAGVFRLEKEDTELSCVDYYFTAADNDQITCYQNQTGLPDVSSSVIISGGADAFGTISEDLTAQIRTVEMILLSAFDK